MKIDVSYLRKIITRDGEPKLHQSAVTDFATYESFAEFARDFWSVASYPRAQASKYETYGWTPTLFEESWTVPKRPAEEPRFGHWRNGEHSAGCVSLIYGDLDNNAEDRPKLSLDDVEAVMREIGAPFILYTSHSHRPDHHKVRIVAAISRTVEYDDAYRLGRWLNDRLGGQLDLSIYDPGDHLYGPPHAGERRQCLTGAPVDVDAILASLPAYTPLQVRGRIDRPQSAEEWAAVVARMADTSTTGEITIQNPKVFRGEWLNLLSSLYCGGSHRQTLLGLMTKAWLRSGGTLSFGDLQALHWEMDSQHGGYVTRKYGKSAVEEDIRTAMATVSRPKDQSVEPRLEALKKRFAKYGEVKS